MSAFIFFMFKSSWLWTIEPFKLKPSGESGPDFAVKTCPAIKLPEIPLPFAETKSIMSSLFVIFKSSFCSVGKKEPVIFSLLTVATKFLTGEFPWAKQFIELFIGMLKSSSRNFPFKTAVQSPEKFFKFKLAKKSESANFPQSALSSETESPVSS